METPCWCPSRWALTRRPKTTETSVADFSYESVNVFLEELKTLTFFSFFSNTCAVQIAKFREMSLFEAASMTALSAVI